MKVIVAGGRDVVVNEVNYHTVSVAIAQSGFDVTEVVSGAARGVDKMGEMWAENNRVPIRRYPANWAALKKAAGPIRNEEMARYADGLVAIWDGKSPGTRNMIETARRLGLRVHVHTLKATTKES